MAADESGNFPFAARLHSAAPVSFYGSRRDAGTESSGASGGCVPLGWHGNSHPGLSNLASCLLADPAAQARDRMMAYAIYGGTPRYLATIDSTKALAYNVARYVLPPNGNVRIQVETAVAQEHGLRDISDYNSILSAIGWGATQRNEIAMQTLPRLRPGASFLLWHHCEISQ